MGSVAVGALFVFALWAAAETPNYSHMENTVSQLAAQGQPHPQIMGVGFVVFGLLAAAFGVGVGVAVSQDGSRRTGAVAGIGLGVYGVAIALTGFAQDYPIGGPEIGIEGYLHSLFAQIAVAGLLAAMAALLRDAILNTTPTYAWYTGATAVLIALFGLAFLAFGESVQGLMQRLLYLVTLGWIAVTTHHLRSRIPRSPSDTPSQQG